MCTAELINTFKDIAIGIAACVTAYVAFTGLSKWQKELSGNANFETARELARKTYALRDQLAYCRSPMTSANEYPEKYHERIDHTAKERGDAWAYVYKNRWVPVADAISSFDAAALEAEALWGSMIRD